MAEVQVLQGCEGFAFGEGKVGALLVHGFTGSPQGMRGLGEYLAARDISVAAPRLPGHGTSWEDLSTRRSEEWVQTVETSFDHLRSQTEEVFIVGLSFGAALSLHLAARRPAEVKGIVTLAGMVFVKDPRRHFAPVIARLVRSIPGVGNDIADPAGKELAYDRVPTKATLGMLRYLKMAEQTLPEVTAPILIMHGRQDHTVHPSNAQHIYDKVSSRHKELITLERSYHVITLDLEKDAVFERTYDFIKEHSDAL
ncbi:MAG: alpha/beta hydrolase [Actinomycetota bacterium]